MTSHPMKYVSHPLQKAWETKLQRHNAIIIGAGPSGIAMAHSMKYKLGFDDFAVYEKLHGVGGTWLTNTYPGCGCDVPTHLYSFSFNLNPNWTKELCDQPEILDYMNSTVDKFNLRPHMHFNIGCLGASWDARRSHWIVHFRDLRCEVDFDRYATILISAVGGISLPRDVRFPGMDSFQGEMFHTARWNHEYDYAGKRMAIIGNGCSAAQVVPSVVDKAASVKQYARSPQWYHERPNRKFSDLEKACFRYIPLWQRFHRLQLFRENDNLVATYMPGRSAAKKREAVEAGAKKYIHSRAPEKYHDMLIPDFPLGCKRRIFDPNYLDALHHSNIQVVPRGIREIVATGIVDDAGERTDFDVIVLATGFQVQKFLAPMTVKGLGGIDLNDQWNDQKGAQAYMGSFMHNFPNFAILFGPNTFPAHNSALFTCEVQVQYVTRALLAPLLDHRADIITVKREEEDAWVGRVHEKLSGSVFSAGCSNWYINEHGRNGASWPGYASAFWAQALIPRRRAFEYQGGTNWWVVYALGRWLRSTGFKETYKIFEGRGVEVAGFKPFTAVEDPPSTLEAFDLTRLLEIGHENINCSAKSVPDMRIL